jgi:hypothetical protein
LALRIAWASSVAQVSSHTNVLHIVAPEPTTRYLTAFNSWLRAHGQTVLVWVLAVAGGVMIGNGIYGLAGG